MRILGLGIACAALLLTSACEQIESVTAPAPFNGAAIVLEVDGSAAIAQQLDSMSEQMAGALRHASVRYDGRGVRDGVVRIHLVEPTDMGRANDALAPITGHMVLTEMPDGLIEARFKDEFATQAVTQVTQQSIQIIQRRMEGLHVQVSEHAPGRLIIRSRANTLPQEVRERIAPQGQLTFHLVRDSIQGTMPAGTMLAQPYFDGGMAEIVNQRVEFTGERLVSASPSTDSQTGQFVLSFALDGEGTRLFCRITRENTGRRFAMLFDGKVITAPTINEPICGGSGQISGNFTAQSANDLALILRAGALPAPFHIVEELPPRAP